MGLAGLPAGHRRRRDLPALDDVGLGLDAVGRRCSRSSSPCVVGSLMGILRTTPSKALVCIGNAWTELFRNIPLLVQIFLWYHVIPSIFLSLRGVPSFVLVVFALGFFTSARISEQVRAGIQSLPQGPALRRPGDGPDAAADLPLRAAADGLPDHHPAAHQRVDEHHQEHLGGVRGEHRRADDVRDAGAGGNLARRRDLPRGHAGLYFVSAFAVNRVAPLHRGPRPGARHDRGRSDEPEPRLRLPQLGRHPELHPQGPALLGPAHARRDDRRHRARHASWR